MSTSRPALDFDKLRGRRLFIATPCYGNQLHVGYHQSICQLLTLCLTRQIRLGIKHVGCDSLVPRARNRLVAHFFDSDCSDLLFIDSDISFTPEDALSLLALEEGVVGGVYPRKQLDWVRISRAARAGIQPDQLPHYGYVPVMNWQQAGDYDLDSLMEVRHLGTGFLRIRREVFETMIAKLGEAITFDYAQEEVSWASRTGYDFFPIGPDIRYPLGSGGRQYLSEDWGFSELARQCGYKLYAAPWIRLTHSGAMDYSGSLEVMDYGVEELLQSTEMSQP